MTANTFATEDYADAAAAAVVDSAPGTLDTLNELAAALGDDANFATTVTTALAGKQPLDSDLTAIAALTTTSYGRAFLELANAAAGLTALGLDADLSSFALPASTTISAFGASLVDDAAASNARTTLGLGTAATNATGDFQPIDSDLTALAALTTTAFGRGLLELANAAAAIAALGLDADLATLSLPASTTISAFGASLIDDAAASNARTTLGLGTAATSNTGDFDAAGAAAAAQAASQPLDADLTTLAGLTATTDNIIQSVAGAWASRTPAQVRTALALVIGTNVQAWDADLDTIASLTATTDNLIQSVAGVWASRTPAQLKATLALVKGDVGLGNVDNTSDANKPVSTAQQAALNLKANIASPTFTGTVTIPTGASITAPTGLVKGDVGLGNVDNTADASKTFAGEAITSGTVAIARLPLDADLATLSLPASTTISAFGATLVDDANAAAAIATLGLDADIATLALPASTTISAFGASLIDDAAAANAQTTLGLVIGTNVEAWDADLDAIAALSPANDDLIQRKSGAWTNRTLAQLRTDLRLPDPDTGWTADTNEWVYASATSFTVTGIDATGYLFPGTKISYDDGDGTVDYGVVASATFSTNTTITLIANTSHSIADPGGSHVLITPRYANGIPRPKGFNNVLTYTPTITGFGAGAAPTSTAYRFTTWGNFITVLITEAVDGTANTAARTYTAPVAATSNSNAQWQTTAALSDNGAVLAAPGLARILSAGTVIDIFKDYASTIPGFTNAAGSRTRSCTLVYQFG